MNSHNSIPILRSNNFFTNFSLVSGINNISSGIAGMPLGTDILNSTLYLWLCITFDLVTQKWMYDNFNDYINNQKVFNIQKDMSNDEIEKVLLGKEENSTIELKYTIQ